MEQEDSILASVKIPEFRQTASNGLFAIREMFANLYNLNPPPNKLNNRAPAQKTKTAITARKMKLDNRPTKSSSWNEKCT